MNKNELIEFLKWYNGDAAVKTIMKPETVADLYISNVLPKTKPQTAKEILISHFKDGFSLTDKGMDTILCAMEEFANQRTTLPNPQNNGTKTKH
jgi:hypothetical protein